ncbi:MAG: hypothetical protein H6512_08915 [Acidimicrobiia bacterium]|nr:hypothetical protein [Acidimicrobiia bacterium]
MSKCVDVVWEGGGYGPRAHRKPFRYQAFVPDLIADWDVSTTGAASEEVSRATAELTHLVKTTTEASSAGQLASVLAAPLTRSEALGSSFIEGSLFPIAN